MEYNTRYHSRTFCRSFGNFLLWESLSIILRVEIPDRAGDDRVCCMALFVRFCNPIKTHFMRGDFHFCWYDHFLEFVARCHPRANRNLIQKMVDNSLCEGDPRFHGDDNFFIFYSFLLYKLRAVQHTRDDNEQQSHKNVDRDNNERQNQEDVMLVSSSYHSYGSHSLSRLASCYAHPPRCHSRGSGNLLCKLGYKIISHIITYYLLHTIKTLYRKAIFIHFTIYNHRYIL